eukprot:546051-Pelagomonas_calceolata.AAC.1
METWEAAMFDGRGVSRGAGYVCHVLLHIKAAVDDPEPEQNGQYKLLWINNSPIKASAMGAQRQVLL